jgi:hypothetical protein
MYLNNLYSINTVFNEISAVNSVPIVVDTLFNALSVTSSITAYNAAPVGSWVPVTSSEYANVISTVPGTNTYVMPTSSISLGTSAAWGAGYATTVLSAYAQLPSNTYIIGFVSRAFSTTGNAAPLVSYTFEGTYTEIASSARVTSSNTYYIRKAPTNSLSATGYVAIVGDQNMAATNTLTNYNYGYSNNTSGTITNGTYVVTTPWTANNATPVFFQVLGTTLKNW